jgi:hypothetical protein
MSECIAHGSFTVKLHPAPIEEERVHVPRMLIDKLFEGDLKGTGQGQMLSAGNPASGSAAYVAIEQVSGELNGRRGSFWLHHTGVMDAGAQSLVIKVVPGSGTGELSGLSGQMGLDLGSGQHRYTFTYSL